MLVVTAPKPAAVAAGANKLINFDPPVCGLDNMDPTTYDVRGTFYYARVSLKM